MYACVLNKIQDKQVLADLVGKEKMLLFSLTSHMYAVFFFSLLLFSLCRGLHFKFGHFVSLSTRRGQFKSTMMCDARAEWAMESLTPRDIQVFWLNT